LSTTDRTPESGESLREMADRVTGAFGGLEGNGTVLVVAHGGPLCALLGRVKGMSLSAALSAHHLDNCGVSEFDAGGDGKPRVVSENVTAWRDG
jgi:broad specificity phosphatase PhoE